MLQGWGGMRRKEGEIRRLDSGKGRLQWQRGGGSLIVSRDKEHFSGV